MNRHYAISDIHGLKNLWTQISDYCDDSDVIYFLGDANDRGDNGIELIQTLLLDKRVRYIRGNHEEILIEAAISNDPYLLLVNGGSKTWDDFNNLEWNLQERLIKKLKVLPNQLDYINTQRQRIILNHAGFILQNYTNDDLRVLGNKYPNLNLYTWDRDHFDSPWCLEDNAYLVHGHTPAQYVNKTINSLNQTFGANIKEDEILCYCNGHKFDLDIASIHTHKIALFDLDTLSVNRYFTIEE